MTRIGRVAACSIGTLLQFNLMSASDGAIPIWQATTITAPGKYVVTRNIEVHDGTPITIAANYVDLDLNGFTITGDTPIVAAGVSGLHIHDGTIAAATSSDNGPRFTDITQFAIRRLIIRSGDDQALSLTNATNGVVADNILSPLSGGDEAIVATAATYVEFLGNRFTGFTALRVTGSHNRIAANTGDGVIVLGGVGNVVRDNIATAISGTCTGNYVENNYASVLCQEVHVSRR